LSDPLSTDRPPPGHNPWAVSLRLVIVFITCFAVALGLIWHWPGVGPIAVLGLVIAALRSWSMMRAMDIKEGVGKSWGLAIIGSLGVVALTATAAASAFVAVCFPLGASQFHIHDTPPVKEVLYDTAYFFGGVAGAIAAGLILDQTWLKPLAERARTGRLATLRQRSRSFIQTAIPPLAAISIGGIFSLIPAAVAASFMSRSPIIALAAFLACVTTYVGGGWLGIQATRYSMIGMAAFLGFGFSVITTLIVIWLPGVLGRSLAIDQSASVIFAGIVGTGAGAVTALVARWSLQPD
jgi:hypothetical protein